MTAAERVLPLLQGVRARDESRGIFLCPAHRDQRASGAYIINDGKLLMICRTGCTALEITTAIGLQLRDLFDDDERGNNRRVVPFRLTTKRTVREWRSAELTRVAKELRLRDELASSAADYFAAGTISEDECFEFLGQAFHNYSEIECQFKILRTGTDEEAEALIMRIATNG